MLACCEEILKEKKGFVCRHTSVPDFFIHSQVLIRRHLYCCTCGDDDPGVFPTVQEDVPPP
jgi:hypothetical protein